MRGEDGSEPGLLYALNEAVKFSATEILAELE